MFLRSPPATLPFPHPSLLRLPAPSPRAAPCTATPFTLLRSIHPLPRATPCTRPPRRTTLFLLRSPPATLPCPHPSLLRLPAPRAAHRCITTPLLLASRTTTPSRRQSRPATPSTRPAPRLLPSQLRLLARPPRPSPFPCLLLRAATMSPSPRLSLLLATATPQLLAPPSRRLLLLLRFPLQRFTARSLLQLPTL